MTKTFRTTYQVQPGEKASERAACRYRTRKPEPSGPDIMHLPHDEWAYLIACVRELNGDLHEEYEIDKGLTEKDTRWLRDRLIEGHLLVHLLECSEFRQGYRHWIDSVGEELQLIYERQSPKLL